MNYENTHLINSNSFSKKYTSKITENYEGKYCNLTNNITLSKWANNNTKENVNSIENLDLTNINVINIKHNNDLKKNDDDTDDDDTDDDDIDNNYAKNIKANMKYLNNLCTNRWKNHNYKEIVNSIDDIEFVIKKDNNTIYQKIEYQT